MAGIAGICRPEKTAEVNRMLDSIAHRGRQRHVFAIDGCTLGVNYGTHDTEPFDVSQQMVRDSGCCRFAIARISNGRLTLLRDAVGIAPLYYGHTKDGALCFASEVKALLQAGSTIAELPPGSSCDGTEIKQRFHIRGLPETRNDPDTVARTLLYLLTSSVRRCPPENAGAWLSGGLDSSAIVALALLNTKSMHTFAAGIAGSEDLKFARLVADYLKTDHHEVVLTLQEMLRILPDVIYHLESFDALLVRSSVMNFAASKVASRYVSSVFSGEGGDELFAGYEYLKSLPAGMLASELLDITGRLHNTALQRVDRSASAHGLTPCVCFLDPAVIEYAITIPVQYKLKDGVEKWILRQALRGLLPDPVLNRPKAKFWQGSGVQDLIARHADAAVTDADFRREHQLPNGWTLDTKEELFYFRMFRSHFGMTDDLGWMGRTKKITSAKTVQ